MTTLGGYQLLGSLSSGGMGHVFLAERATSLGFRKRFAIKTLRRTLVDREDSVAAFIDEARLVAQLEHKNIAQVFDFGFDGDTPFIVMEYVSGTSVQEFVQQRGALPHRAAFEIMREAADGLHAAHVAHSLETGDPLRVVHRDVSLSNIMLSTQGEVKLVDFGIALAHDRMTPATMTGTIKGKPSYMSPEQLQGEPVDPRTDVFALWVVFAEMILGRSLFGRKTLYDTTRAVMEAPLPTADDLAPNLPEELDSLLAAGLHRDCAERMGSAQEIMAAMDRLLPMVDGDGIAGILEHVHDLVPELRPLDDARVDLPEREEDLPTQAVTSRPETVLVRRRRWPAAAAGLSLIGALVIAVGFAFRGSSGAEPLDAPPVVEDARARKVAKPPGKSELAAEQPTETPRKLKPEPEPIRARKRRNAAPKRVKAPLKRPTAAVVKPVSEATPTEFGQLSVFADPFARVRIDGREIGVTPILNYRIPVGEHAVELLDPDSGGVRKTRRVKVAEGERLRVTDRAKP
ncbi:MAG: protein kinase [Myxococcota bacterium]